MERMKNEFVRSSEPLAHGSVWLPVCPLLQSSARTPVARCALGVVVGGLSGKVGSPPPWIHCPAGQICGDTPASSGFSDGKCDRWNSQCGRRETGCDHCPTISEDDEVSLPLFPDPFLFPRPLAGQYPRAFAFSRSLCRASWYVTYTGASSLPWMASTMLSSNSVM